MAAMLRVPPKGTYFRLLGRKRLRRTIECRVCGLRSNRISAAHLLQHGMTVSGYRCRYGRGSLVNEQARWQQALNAQIWPDGCILEELRRLAVAGVKLYASEMERKWTALYGQACRAYGTWLQAVEAAGLSRAEHTKVSRLYRWNPERVRSALRNRVALGQPLRRCLVLQEDASLVTAVSRYFGPWHRALRAAGLQPRDYVREPKWSRHRLVLAIKARAAAGQPLNYRAVHLEHNALGCAAVERFGSWDKALRAAGFDPASIRKRRCWGREDVITAIQRLKTIGHGLSYVEVLSHDAGIVRAGVMHYESWDAALLAAGVKPDCVRRARHPWTRESILEHVRNAARRGQRLNWNAVRPESILNAATAHFGSWEATLKAAGLNPAKICRARLMCKGEVVAQIRRLATDAQPLNYIAISRAAPRLMRSGYKWFGSWGKALQAAGIDLETATMNPKWSHRTILDWIWTEHTAGRPLNHAAVHGRMNYEAVSRLFGSWDAALEAAGLDAAKIRKTTKWSPTTVIAAIQARIAEALPLNIQAVHKGCSGLIGAAQLHFGSWDNALRKAGMNPAWHRLTHPRWTRESIIAALRDLARKGQPLRGYLIRPNSLYTASLRIFGSWKATLAVALQS